MLPQVASTFNPTKIATALLAIAVALVTAAGDRWLQLRKQRRVLETSVRAWPPERLGEADPATLGVYPPRNSDGKPEPYRPRPEDADLDAALSGSASVLVVHGPAGAGKSRAASEAARRTLSGVPAIVPLNAEALRSIADSGLRLNGRESHVCVWLDGIDRFVDVLDPRVLDTLQGLAPDTKIVTTVRTDQWRELLSGTGERSEATRAVDDAATTIELGPLPTRPGPGPPATAPDRDDDRPSVVGPIWRRR